MFMALHLSQTSGIDTDTVETSLISSTISSQTQPLPKLVIFNPSHDEDIAASPSLDGTQGDFPFDDAVLDGVHHEFPTIYHFTHSQNKR